MMSTFVPRTLRVAAAALVFAASPAMADQPVAEFPVETEALVAATSALFDEVQSAGGDERRQRTPVIQMPQLATKASLNGLGEGAGPLKLNGPLKHLTGYRINWYPMERFLGSVDFMGTWDGNRNLVCGYVTWDLSDPSAPVLETVAANYVDLDELANVSEADVHEALLEANCAFGAIDANFGFFEVES